MKFKEIITDDMLFNMTRLAETCPAMREILDQAMVVYALAGSPSWIDDEDCDDEKDYDDDDEGIEEDCDEDEYERFFGRDESRI